MVKRCGARLATKDYPCPRRVVKGKNRCYKHGGLSTGPKTPEGMARVVAASQAGVRRWLENQKALYAAGLIDKISPRGRKPGAGWITKNMRAKRGEKLEEIPSPTVDIEGALKAIETLRARLIGRP